MTGSGTVAAVLLAAGESRRMGAVNKLTLPVAGVPLVRRIAINLLQSRLGDVVAVLGHQETEVRTALHGLPLRLVVNPHHADGQMTSVTAGLAALSDACAGVMVCLGDQPLIESEDVDRLIDAFLGRARGSVLVPTHGGRRGNPVVLDCAHREDILGGGRNLGCRHLIERNPDLVETVEWPNDHVVFDLDTPQDYQALVRRLVGGRSPNGARAANG